MFWGTLAVLNLAAGTFTSSRPQRLYDLDTMMQWGRYWLVDRANVYAPGPWGNVDYPPNAIVVLSPLGLLSFDQAHPVWMGLNIIMAVLTPYFAARFFRPHDPFRVIALPILLFLCWGGTRTVTQFSLIALMFSMLAMRVAVQRPIAGGVWLGLALMKPQVAIPVFLWSVFTRRWSVALTSVAVVGLLTAVFCVWSGTNPLSIPHAYLQTLASYHTGEALLQGISEFRPLVIQVTGDVLHADGIVGAIAMVLMAGILVVGVQEGAVRARVLYAAPPLVACWSLMTFYHLTYGFVILLPVLMLLALNDTPPSALRRRLFWLLQFGMMFDIPSLSRLAGLADTALFRIVLVHTDRALLAVLFFGLIALAVRERQSTMRATASRLGLSTES